MSIRIHLLIPPNRPLTDVMQQIQQETFHNNTDIKDEETRDTTTDLQNKIITFLNNITHLKRLEPMELIVTPERFTMNIPPLNKEDWNKSLYRCETI